MGSSSLLDRIWSALRESGRAWTSQEVAGRFLMLAPGGPSPDGLVRKILGADRRLREEPAGSWLALAAPPPSLNAGAYLLCWLEGAEQPSPRHWRAHLLPFGEAGTQNERTVTIPSDRPDLWEEARRTWAERRLATVQLGPLQRWQQWMGRAWALPEWEHPPLDLLAWTRLALVEEGVPPAATREQARLSAVSRRWGLGPEREGAGAPLVTLGALLDHLLEKQGGRTEDEVASALALALGARPVAWEQYAFSRQDLDELPTGSGIYRFYDSAGGLLYVGKALNLARRVGSYFRPLAPDAGKREELIGRIHRLEIEPTPSELEAMVLEARAIRTEQPTWNVQVEVHPCPQLPPAWWWPVVFLAPGSDPARASVFLLRGPASGCLFHLAREEQPGEAVDLAGWLDAVLPGAQGAEEEAEAAPIPDGPGVLLLDPPETHLVLRFYLRARDRCHRVDSIHFTSGCALADALLRLVRGTEEGPFDMRPEAEPGSS
jgi:hypothetical protein